ncbi:unnamed protein product [Prunus brigantina]
MWIHILVLLAIFKGFYIPFKPYPSSTSSGKQILWKTLLQSWGILPPSRHIWLHNFPFIWWLQQFLANL